VGFITDPSRQAWVDKNISWTADDVRVVLIQTTGTGSVTPSSSWTTLADITSGARVFVSSGQTPTSLANKTNVSGVMDADDFTCKSVFGNAAGAVALIQFNAGTPEASRVLIVIDSGPGLPVTPNGGDITLQWNNGTNKIAKI
jgi:hypothetical protein